MQLTAVLIPSIASLIVTPPHTTQARQPQSLRQEEIRQPLLLRASGAPNCSHLLPLGNLGEGLAQVFPVLC